MKERKYWANLPDGKQKVSKSFSQYVKITSVEEKPYKLLENNNALEQNYTQRVKGFREVALHQFSAGYYDRVNSLLKGDKLPYIKYKIKTKPNSEGRMVDGLRHEYVYNACVVYHPDVKFRISNTEERGWIILVYLDEE